MPKFHVARLSTTAWPQARREPMLCIEVREGLCRLGEFGFKILHRFLLLLFGLMFTQ